MRTRLSRLWSTAAPRAAAIQPLLAVACLMSALGLQAAGRTGAADTVRLE